MTEKDKSTEEYERLQDEIVRDKIKEIFAKEPANYRKALREIGFTWHDDEYPSEEEEESAAVPKNDRQRLLVSYFEGGAEPSTSMVQALLAEKNSSEPNYPLIRKYFRARNPSLKALILLGLQNAPTNFDLLTDLILFNEFDRNLPELIEHLTNACRLEDDLQKFSEIALEFYFCTRQDNYNALAALKEIFDKDSDKGKVIDFLISEQERQDREDIRF